jgi:amidohydrolase
MTETMDSQLIPSLPKLTGTDLTLVAAQLQPFLVECRRYLHQHPEVGFNEFNTASFVRGILRSAGFKVKEAAETGSWVEIEGSKPGPTLAYRADLDALPMQDAKEVPYCSKNAGVAHLCGHDAHTTIAMGVALLAQHHKSDFHGTLRVFFQPNEEGVPSGAPRMIEAGALQNVSGVLGIHLDPTLDSGRFGLIKGPVTATSDRFDLHIVGPRSLHSARPHTGADCVWLATQIAQSLYGLAGRTTDARVPIVLSICRFRAGEAYNVIPKVVEMGGSVRCSENEARAPFKEKMEAVAQQMAQLHGAEARFTWYEGSPAMFNDANLVDVAGQCIENLHGTQAIHRIDKPSMGAEDFAYYQEKTAGAMIRVGSRSGADTAHPLHSTLFDLDENIMGSTAATMTQILFQLSKKRGVNS